MLSLFLFVIFFLSKCSDAAITLPVFSWDTVPVFFHSSVLNDATFCAADLAVISRFPAVTIEKWMGCNSTPGCYVPGSGGGPDPSCLTQQEATLASARALLALRPSASIVAWFDSLRVYSQRHWNPDIVDVSWQSCVRNANSPFLESHAAAYLLHNASGGLAEEPYLHAHVYDHAQAAVRDFWRDACLNMTATGLISGCGADASQQTAADVIGLSPAAAAAWTQGHVWAVSNATAALEAQGGLILGKVEAQLGFDTNGVLQEGCNGNGTITALRAAAAAARAARGRRFIFECHSDAGAEADLATFLIGAGTDAFFGMGQWVYPDCGGAAAAWMDAFALPLGAPLADAVYEHPLWRRSFAKGVNVTFNAATNDGSIAWPR